MKASERIFRPTRMALIITAAGLLPLAAHAQAPSMAEMQARYKEDIQRCETLTDPASKQTCQREAGAALQEARRDRLVRGNVDTAANAAQRCQRLPTAQRADCERLMRDSGAVEHGSVSGGGVLRELTITVPADTVSPGTPAPAPAGSYGTQPAPGAYSSPAAPGSYGTQPAPGSYSTQPMQAR
ncbi:MAG: hypothetical protein WCX93_03130 [Burkholderiaceae bacterium]